MLGRKCRISPDQETRFLDSLFSRPTSHFQNSFIIVNTIFAFFATKLHITKKISRHITLTSNIIANRNFKRTQHKSQKVAFGCLEIGVKQKSDLISQAKMYPFNSSNFALYPTFKPNETIHQTKTEGYNCMQI